MPTNRTRVAIAGIWDAHDSYACALLLWCQNAAAFGKLLASAGLVASPADVDTVLLLSGGTADEQRRARDTVRADCIDAIGEDETRKFDALAGYKPTEPTGPTGQRADASADEARKATTGAAS